MPDDPVLRVRVTAPTRERLQAFLEETRPDFGCRPAARRTRAGLVTDVYVPESRLAAVRGSRSAAGIDLVVVENVTAMGRAAQEEVGRGDRFAARGAVPRGFGRKE